MRASVGSRLAVGLVVITFGVAAYAGDEPKRWMSGVGVAPTARWHIGHGHSTSNHRGSHDGSAHRSNAHHGYRSYFTPYVPRHYGLSHGYDWPTRYYYDRHVDRFYDRSTRVWLTPYGFELRVGGPARGWRYDSDGCRQHYREYGYRGHRRCPRYYNYWDGRYRNDDRYYRDRYDYDRYYDDRYYDDRYDERCDD